MANFLWPNQAPRIIIDVTIIELIVLVSKGLRNCSTSVMHITVINMTAAKPPIPMTTMIKFRAWELADVGGIGLANNC